MQNGFQRAQILKIDPLAIGFDERTVLRRLFFFRHAARGLIQQGHGCTMPQRELLVIDTAPQVENFCALEHFRAQLPLKGSADVGAVFRVGWIGQAHGGDEDGLAFFGSKAPKGLAQAQHAARVQRAHVDDGVLVGKPGRVRIGNRHNACAFGQRLRVPARATVMAAIEDNAVHECEFASFPDVFCRQTSRLQRANKNRP